MQEKWNQFVYDDYIREKGVEEYRYLMKDNKVLCSADGTSLLRKSNRRDK